MQPFVMRLGVRLLCSGDNQDSFVSSLETLLKSSTIRCYNLSGMQQAYVSNSRFRERQTIYTTDVKAAKNAMASNNDRKLAHELREKHVKEWKIIEGSVAEGDAWKAVRQRVLAATRANKQTLKPKGNSMPFEENPDKMSTKPVVESNEWDGPWGSIAPVPQSVETLCIRIDHEAGKSRVYYYPYRTIGKWDWSMDATERLEIQISGVQLIVSGTGLRRLAEAMNWGQLRLINFNQHPALTGDIQIHGILIEGLRL